MKAASIMADPVIPKFRYDPEHDTNDNKGWSEMDLEVRRKAEDMGWWPSPRWNEREGPGG
jgi:hypothetical protein